MTLRLTYLFMVLFVASSMCRAETKISQNTLGPMAFEGFESSTLLEWAQNLGQLCAQKSCARSSRASQTQTALKAELEKRFHQTTGNPFSEISSHTWNTVLQKTANAERCRLLRTAFVLSLLEQIDSSVSQGWRLFTDEKTLKTLSYQGHLPADGKSPLCPDYYYPEADIAELARERGRRFFSAIPPIPEEAENRVMELEKRYRSRGKIDRHPAG
jgi:hypothetical protein